MRILNPIVLFAFMASALALHTGPATAQTLFEFLFKKPKVERRLPDPPVQKVTVSAPKIFRYRPDKMVATRFGKLTAMGREALEASNAAPENQDDNVLNDQVSTASPAAYENPPAVTEDGRNDAPVSAFLKAVALLDGFTPGARAVIAKAAEKHYLDNPEFIWVGDTGPNRKARAVLALLDDAESFGLDVRNYLVTGRSFDISSGLDDDLEAAIGFELTLTLRAARYRLDARQGIIDPNRLSGYHDFAREKVDFEAMIAWLASALNPSTYLLSAHPFNHEFRTLRRELAELRASEEEQIVIAPGTFVKPDASHEELPNIVAAIRKRGSNDLLVLHSLTLAGYEGSPEFDQALVELVRGFQKENGLGADGIVGRRTIAKLVGTPLVDKIERVIYAMERLRWHPQQFGERFVFINQPAYRATYYANGKEALSMRAIVGKRSNQTSFFHDTIETVVYNPYWGVPRSIIVNEMLPKLISNPSYLDARGYEVTDSRGRRVASSNVDWYQVGVNPPYDVRQPPGPRNALGELKILFPNKHAIYMHDTPSRNLFSRAARALSHGCVRLQHPRQMAAAVLGTTKDHIDRKIARGKNAKEAMPEQIPVYVAYFTAWPDTDGNVHYYSDMYGRDQRLAKAFASTSKVRNNSG